MNASEANESGGSAASTPETQTLVELQVGPTLFYATRRTLSKCPVLQRMLAAQGSRDAHVPEHGGASLEGPQRRACAHRLLLDCEPAVFSLVIAYLRTGEIDSTSLIEGRRPPSGTADGRVYEHRLRQEFRLLQLPWPRRCMRCGYLYNHELYTQVAEVTSGQEELTIGQEELPVCYVHPGELRMHPSTHAPLYSCCRGEEGAIGCTACRHYSAQDKGPGCLQNWGCAAPRAAHEGHQLANEMPQKLQPIPRQDEPEQQQELESEQPLQGRSSGESSDGMSDTAAFMTQRLGRSAAADEAEECNPTYSALSCPSELGGSFQVVASTSAAAAEAAEATKEDSSPAICTAQGEGRQQGPLALPAGALVTARGGARQQQPGQQQHQPCWMGPSSHLIPYGPHPMMGGDSGGSRYPRYPYPIAGRMALEEEEEEQQQMRHQQQEGMPPPYCMAPTQQYLAEQQAAGYSTGARIPPCGLSFCPEGLWGCDYVRLQQLPPQQQLLYCPFGCRYTPGGWECVALPQRALQGGRGAEVAFVYGSSSELPSTFTSAGAPPVRRENGGEAPIGASGRQRPWGPRRCRGKRCPRGPSACDGPLGDEDSSCAAGSGDIEDVRKLPEINRDLKQGSPDVPGSPVGYFADSGSGSTKATSQSLVPERKKISAATLPEGDSICGSGDTPCGNPWAPEDAAATPDAANPSYSAGTRVQQQHQHGGGPRSVCPEAVSYSPAAKSSSLDSQPDTQQQEQENKHDGQHQQQRLKARSNPRVQGVLAAPTPNPLFKTRMCQLYKNGLCHQ